MAVYLPLALVWAALALHLAGERRAAVVTGRPRSREARKRALYFYAGLATIFVALVTPIESLARKLFWIHMIQHVLLLTVAAPLIVLGAPWMSIWRPFPLGFRRTVARGVARSPWLGWLRALGRWLGRPSGAFVGYAVTLVAWHIPAAYDYTLRHQWAHAAEHITFLGFGILLWAQLLDSPPLRRRLVGVQRIYYGVASEVVGWVLSLVLAFAPSPLYPWYVHLAHRPGGISALADQQLAAGVMLVPGSLAMSLFVAIELYRWLGQDGTDDAERRSRRGHAAAGAGTPT
jgi:putative membrane protein